MAASPEHTAFWGAAQSTCFFAPRFFAREPQQPATRQVASQRDQCDRFVSLSTLCLDFNKVLRLRYKETGETNASDVFAAVQEGTAREQDVLDENLFRNLSYHEGIEFTQAIWRPRVKLSQELGNLLGREVEAIETMFRESDGAFWQSFGEHAYDDASNAGNQLVSGFVAYNARWREALVVVQGSYVASSDTVVNAESWGIAFGEVIDAFYATESQGAAPADGGRTPAQQGLRGVTVHSGYAWLALHIYKQIRSIIKTQLAGQNKPVDEIVITGHSLGSAVAAQVFMLHHYFEADDFPSTRFSAVLFAQPRSVAHRNISDDLAPLFEKSVLDIRNVADPVVGISTAMYEPLGIGVDFEHTCHGLSGLVKDIAHGHDQDLYKAYVFEIFDKILSAPRTHGRGRQPSPSLSLAESQVSTISIDPEPRALPRQAFRDVTSWREFAGRERGGENYHFGDITRGVCRRVCRRSRETDRVGAPATSWREFAGRERGGENYHFGVVTRGVLRRV